MNFQESTTILNSCTKKSGNLLKVPRMYKKDLALKKKKKNNDWYALKPPYFPLRLYH